LRMTGIVQRLATLGDPEPDEKVVAKYLRVVRPRYKQLVISIETLLDISKLSIEEVTGRHADDRLHLLATDGVGSRDHGRTWLSDRHRRQLICHGREYRDGRLRPPRNLRTCFMLLTSPCALRCRL